MFVLIFTVFFFNDTATTEIYTLSLHDALPICSGSCAARRPERSTRRRSRRRHATFAGVWPRSKRCGRALGPATSTAPRSEEHTSELQLRQYLVCRLLLEKKNQKNTL